MATASQAMPHATPVDASSEPSIPRLESGDRLTREEFERRYLAMPADVHAELIEGVVYVASPVSRKHGRPHHDLIGWTGQYSAFTPGIEGLDNATVRLDLDNEPQPDVLLRIAPEHGGRSSTSSDDYIVGGPEFIAEIAASTESYDLHDKLHAYRRNGVVEYVVWRVRDRAVDWFVLRGGRYELLAPSTNGILQSQVFPGLWLDPSALIQGDLATVLRVLHEGLASPEHAAFVEMLKANAAKFSAGTSPPLEPEAPGP